MEFWKNIKLKLYYKNIIKKCFWIISLIFLLLYLIAFVMKDHANNDNVKEICKEFVNGPRNIIALVINKIFDKEIMTYKTVVLKDDDNVALLPSSDMLAKMQISNIISLFKQQELIDEQLKTEINSGNYTFDDPLVIQDPYKNSPLSAIIVYNTEEPELVSIEVKGKTELADIAFSFEKQGYTTQHIIPVYGLYANTENTVILSSKKENGEVKRKEIKIRTEPLLKELQNINLSVYQGDMSQYQPGLNFSYGSEADKSMKMAFDCNGDIRWYISTEGLVLGNYNQGKSVFVSYGNYDYNDTGEVLITEMNFLGKIKNIYYSTNGNHHDIFVSDRNSLVVMGGHKDSWEDLIYEIDRSNGQKIREIDYRKLLPRGKKPYFMYSNQRPKDWSHMNSVVEYQGDVIVSSNIQSTVMRNSWNGEIKWILADPRDLTTYWKQYILKPIGEDFEYPYNQHAVEVLPDYDHNPDTVDILLFDNGSSRFLVDGELQKNIKLGTAVEPKLYSRLVHYRINEKDMTVEQIWQYGKERPEIFAPTRGDANLLANGNILGNFNFEDGISPYRWAVYTEVNNNKEIIWEVYASTNDSMTRYVDYRLERLSIYNNDNDYMDIGDGINNFVPMEVLKKYGYQN